MMDAHTLELLEFGKIRELLAHFAACDLGKELARQLEPVTDAGFIRAELALVSEMTEALGEGHTPPLGGLHDVRLLVRRAAIGSVLTPDQLLEVAETLTCTGNMFRFRMRLSERYQRLSHLLLPIEDLGAVAKSITSCIDPRGMVLDTASRELTLARQELSDLDERVQEQIRRLLRDPEIRKILRYPNATVSGDHYVLPVSVNFRHKIQGVIHRTSSTGETIYVEPAGIARLSAERAVLKSNEEREVQRVLRKLTAEIARVAKPLSTAVETMARVDLVTAKARFSLDYHMVAPDVDPDAKLWLSQARHPLLQQLFRSDPPGAKDKRQVVPIDVRLGQPYRMLVITGPNTGGKTVCLKTTALLCLMAQSGLHIPAGQGSIVPVLDQVLADIGDEQSLEQSLSTFSSHISRIASILKQARPGSLVLLDELGAGTDPTEGAALGRAILDHLDSIGCLAMVTTHLGDLKTYAFTNQNAENAAVEFDVETLRPSYRLQIGQFGMSNALKIAKRLKLPRELLRRAHRYLRRRQRRAPELARLQSLREDTEKARTEALHAQQQLQQEKVEYEQRKHELEQAALAATALKEFRARLHPGDAVHVLKFNEPGKVARVDHKKNVVSVRVGIGQWEVSLEDVVQPRLES